MDRPNSFRPVVILLVAAACQQTPDAGASRDSAGVDSAAQGSTGPVSGRTAATFEPATAQRGDTVAGLVIDSIERQRTPSGAWVGSASFAGSVVLSGYTFRHPDGDDYPYPCFEADTVSAARLPRWAGDTRRSWFCFENADEAKTLFGGAAANKAATIRVDRFTIHRNLTDAVNSARLVEIVTNGGSTASSDAIRCYATNSSVLARRPGTVAPGPSGLTGWVRLDGLGAGADSGAARFVDSDGRGLGASWRRIGADSLLVVGFDDFLRVEMRLAATDDRLAGFAIATSDAAMERDSTGRLAPFRRRWAVDGRQRPCDALPSGRPA